ncbi:MAG: N-acetylmuramic acid 6-phosphate etherase [Sarcina sp.]
MRSINLDILTTEMRNENTLDIDTISTLEMVKKMNNEDKKVAIAVESELPKVANAIDEILKGMKKGGRLIYIGAGTSGRLGILDASECPPTFGVSDELIKGIIAGGTDAIFKAKEGAEDSREQGELALKEIDVSYVDTIVGIAASGRTPYVIGALEYANSIGATTIAISCNKNSEIGKVADIDIAPKVGAEVITGSTRLKAGTAQKLVLNMLSTGIMIKLGKVYSNLMVDVRSSNEKLTQRSKKILCEATNISYEEAEELLIKTDFDVKLAIFIKLSSLDIDEARERLDICDGYISKGLEKDF